MTKSFAWIIVPALLYVCGCVQSVHPFYTDQQVGYDASLNGNWKVADSPEVILVDGQDDQKQYKITYIDKDKKVGHFIVHLANVGDRMLADVTPDSSQMPDSDVYKLTLLPLHTLMWVEKNPNGLNIKMMDYNWLKNYLKDHPNSLAHEESKDGEFVLTASTADLQAFYVAQLQTSGAYGEGITQLLRLEPTSKP
jgi:hypothetical protein